MLEIIIAWAAKQGAGVILGFVSNLIVEAIKTWLATEQARERGRQEAIAEAATKVAERMKRAKEIEGEIDQLSDDEVRKRLDPDYRD